MGRMSSPSPYRSGISDQLETVANDYHGAIAS